MSSTGLPDLDNLTDAERFVVAAVLRGEKADAKRHEIRASVLRDLVVEARDGWMVPPVGVRISPSGHQGHARPRRCHRGEAAAALALPHRGHGRHRCHSPGCPVEAPRHSLVDDPRRHRRRPCPNRKRPVPGRRQHHRTVADPRRRRHRRSRDRRHRDRRRQGGSSRCRPSPHGPAHLAPLLRQGSAIVSTGQSSAASTPRAPTVTAEGTAIDGESAELRGDFLLAEAKLTGCLKPPAARIRGRLSADKLSIAATPDAVLGNGLDVEQGVSLDGAKLTGTLWLEGAVIGKEFRPRTSTSRARRPQSVPTSSALAATVISLAPA